MKDNLGEKKTNHCVISEYTDLIIKIETGKLG